MGSRVNIIYTGSRVTDRDQDIQYFYKNNQETHSWDQDTK